MSPTSLRTRYVCQSCGYQSSKWLGRCVGCGEWESLVEEAVQSGSSKRNPTGLTPAIPYAEIEQTKVDRLKTGNAEFDRALGGGIVPGSMALLGGDPGIGKSTLLLQIADTLAKQKIPVLYVAGEESAHQIKLRGNRLGIDGDGLFLIAETNLEQIQAEIERVQPRVVVIDSVQTIHSSQLESIPGSIAQIRECAGRLLSYAKRKNVAVFLIGHITKDGSLAGPKMLEHVVDVVLYFEGERHQNQKIIRAVKNRFGPANELGLFEMTGKGLLPVDNPSKMFLSERALGASGSVVLCTMEGSRPVLVELQALVSHTTYSTARRMSNGVDPNRVSLLLAMLEKRLGLHLVGCDVYVNVAGGLTPVEPAVDLAIAAAVISSFRDVPVPAKTVIFGELGLAGEARAVNQVHARVRESKAMAFETVILPKSNLPLSEKVPGIKLVGVSTAGEYLDLISG